MHKPADRIRNVALVGHRGSGKTSLHEALLFEAGDDQPDGLGRGRHHDVRQRPRREGAQMSITAAMSSFEWQERKVNLIDTPGDSSFIADALGALRVCESAIFVINGVMGVEVHASRLWQRAAELDLARLIFVNMLDRERADFFRTLESLKSAFGQHVVATEIPIGSEHEIRGVIDLVDMKAYEYDGAARENCKEIPIPDELAGQAAGVPREADGRGRRELRRADGALPGGRGDLARRDRHGAQGRDQPRRDLPGHLRRRHPQPRRPTGCSTRSSRTSPRRSSTAGSTSARSTLEPVEDKEMFAYVFKTRADPFAGRINMFRVYQGDGQAGLPGAEHPHPHQGADRHAADVRGQGHGHPTEFGPGDIGAVAKLKETKAGDWLAARDEPIEMPQHQAAGAGHGLRRRAEEQGRRGEGVHRAAPPPGGGPDDRPAPRRADRRADRGRALAGPRRGDRRAAEVALRRRGQPEPAARALPGDDPQAGQGARPPQEADRRPRPVRRLPHRDRAARAGRGASSSSTRSRAA